MEKFENTSPIGVDNQEKSQNDNVISSQQDIQGDLSKLSEHLANLSAFVQKVNESVSEELSKEHKSTSDQSISLSDNTITSEIDDIPSQFSSTETEHLVLPGTAIVLEGGEGVGKGTIGRHLKTRLDEIFTPKGYQVVILREPGGTVRSERIRSLILDDIMEGSDYLTESLLYAAARRELFLNELNPLLQDKKTIVILDRFVYSSYVYQGIVAEGGSLAPIIKMNNLVLDNWQPDFIFCLDLDPRITRTRIEHDIARNVNRFDVRSLSFHEKIRQGYRSLSFLDNYHIIDAGRSVEDITGEILELICPFIEEKAQETENKTDTGLTDNQTE